MKAKFIYEKFTDESDPIHDMGIGVESKYKEYAKLCNFKRITNKENVQIVQYLINDIFAKDYDEQEGLNLLNYILKTKIQDINDRQLSDEIIDTIKTKNEIPLRIKLIDIFIKNGLDIHCADDRIFLHSIYNAEGILAISEYLLKLGANINAKQGEALIDAIAEANDVKIRFLFKHGLVINNTELAIEFLKYVIDYNIKDLIPMAISKYVKLNNIKL